MGDDPAQPDPVLRNARHQRIDAAGSKFVEKTEEYEQKARAHKLDRKKQDKKDPPGGFDNTPVPRAPRGYTIKFTFHRAHNLPAADIKTLSSDPYIIATLKTDLPKRNKQDPDLRLRTPTIHHNTSPEWNAEWVVANVPASGFQLKCRLYDEDAVDHDDKLGNVHVDVANISEGWAGFKEKSFDIEKRTGSKRAYCVRGCAAVFLPHVKMGGELVVSVENLGRTTADYGGRAFTVGPLYWSRHFSPIIGRLTGIKDTIKNDRNGKKKIRKYKYAPSSVFPMGIYCSLFRLLASKQFKCNLLARFPKPSITAMWNSNHSLLGCSTLTLSRVVF